jgi:DNA-binding transcriptional ArsR family regulator
MRLSRRLREPLDSVSYHLRVLAECEVVEPVGSQPPRGSTERLYRVSIADEEMLSALERAALSNPPRGEENG